ncbi:hypothetical protein HMPREF9104_00838 [Lentilactobacillus kisonensis F0435]|uniref:Uncharacterized protein n=1 Tax=Lentilactobacillus kisonensis F0435 TaxID=797516 RepID=H1LE12_9LACO|nr:hypothetical protein HMPREF9104_00838 [Lentilactobacillus kisonensis F0435]
MRTAAQSRDLRVSTSNKNPKTGDFPLEETYTPIPNRFAPLTYF